MTHQQNPPPPENAAPPQGSVMPPPPDAAEQYLSHQYDAGVEAWPPAGSTVVASGVSKTFGGLVAVSNISVAFQPGVTALLGPNGAGKSTLMRVICGLTPPTTGQIWVAGGDPRSDANVRARIGIVPQQDGVFERETALATVTLAATLNNLDDPQAAALAALEEVELGGGIERPVGEFSKGMRQRVKIAQAIVHDPEVIVLDEPLNGLDPKQRREMIRLFTQLGDKGKTVIVSSHVLDEVERFGSLVVVIAKGRLAATGDFRSIRSLMDNQPLRVRVRCSKERTVAGDLLASEPSIVGCSIAADGAIEITTVDVRRFRVAIAKVCQQNESHLSEVTALDDDLESVFKYLVGTR